MPLLFYIVMLIITLIGLVFGILIIARGDGDTSTVVLLFICALLGIYWSINVFTYDKDAEKRNIVSIETKTAPQIDTIITNRADTLYIYNFINPIKVND